MLYRHHQTKKNPYFVLPQTRRFPVLCATTKPKFSPCRAAKHKTQTAMQEANCLFKSKCNFASASASPSRSAIAIASRVQVEVKVKGKCQCNFACYSACYFGNRQAQMEVGDNEPFFLCQAQMEVDDNEPFSCAKRRWKSTTMNHFPCAKRRWKSTIMNHFPCAKRKAQMEVDDNGPMKVDDDGPFSCTKRRWKSATMNHFPCASADESRRDDRTIFPAPSADASQER